MPDNPEDFWPADIGEATIVTPVSIMRTQAAILGQRTNQQITANVQAIGSGPTEVVWSFQLVSPALGGYRYELFRVFHPLTIYPAKVMWEEHPLRNVKNEAEFTQYLKEILRSDQTKNVVQSLLAQIKS